MILRKEFIHSFILYVKYEKKHYGEIRTKTCDFHSESRNILDTPDLAEDIQQCMVSKETGAESD